MERTTRRAAFGAIGSIAAAGLIAAHTAHAAAAAPISPNGDRWWRLHAIVTRLETQLTAEADFANAERIGELHQSLHWRLMALPAPDAKAALWKFDYLIEPEEDETPAWNLEKPQVAAAFADLRRVIGGEA